MNRIKAAASEALNLAVFVTYPTKETVEILLQKAEREKISIESKLPAEETLKEEPKTEEQPVEQKTEDKVEEKSTQDSDKEPEVKDEAPKTQGKEEDQKSEEKPLETKDQSGYSEDSAKKAEQLLDQLKQDNI